MKFSRIADRFRFDAALFAAIAVLLLASTLAAVSQSAAVGIRAILAADSSPNGESPDIAAVRAFYEQRSYQPAWTGSERARSEAQLMLSALVHADADGLDPAVYHVDDAVLRRVPQTPASAVEFDVLLTDGALRFARELRTGRAELRSLDRDVDFPAQVFDPVASLSAAVASDSIPGFLASLPPPHREYLQLKIGLARYRKIAANGGWPVLPDSFADNVAASGDVSNLRRRLASEDQTAANSDSLADAVKQFQARNGIPANGRLGRDTLQALNVSASERATQIAANMERWRWLPRTFETSYVAVNVPEQQLAVIGPHGPVLTSRVVVGRPSDPTPLFRAVATSVTVNPPWNVPVDIARREMLPKLRRNRGYLQAHDMILRNGPPGDPYGLHINWQAMPASAFHYQVQQRPGPKNALGSVKLELPNRFNVYLHYTSAQTLFGLDSRALSHGCVRVEQILPLASYALTGDSAAGISSLQNAIATGTTQHLSLANDLPIYFLYWTAFVDAEGAMQFRRDVYGRDQRLIAALENRVANERVALSTVECTPA